MPADAPIRLRPAPIGTLPRHMLRTSLDFLPLPRGEEVTPSSPIPGATAESTVQRGEVRCLCTKLTYTQRIRQPPHTSSRVGTVSLAVYHQHGIEPPVV